MKKDAFIPARKKIHFVGIGGTGMSALAQVARWQGREVSGSDRFFDRGEAADLRQCLEGEGIAIFPQDGSGVKNAAEAVSSAAVEAEIPDLRAAETAGVPVVSRGDYLLRLTRGRESLAVAGTNGKSTTAALLSWILARNDRDPTFVIGAPLKEKERGWGNARLGKSEWFCFEADESDGVLERYLPAHGVITNISPDHFEIERLREIFGRFAGSCRKGVVLNADCPESRLIRSLRVPAVTFSVDAASDFRAREIDIGRERSFFTLCGVRFLVPLPGLHNVYNSLAAVAAASLAGLDPARAAPAVADFPGVKRRMEIVYSSPALVVIDDYSHNPAKIAAALETARRFGLPVTAVYQPHGFAPLRRFRRELAAAFSRGLGAGDRLILLPVYYPGGTVQPGFGSEELAAVIAGPARVSVLPGPEALLADLERSGGSGMVCLIMGARDPGLSALARRISRQIAGEKS
ncbi:MAG: Mur ligase family protein [PVC group bacterium]